ncbi:MAG TPA: hypothetical protein VM344_01050 [Vitreimonas sp.]|nr:hypothetical protein [Vitreimonas sp.]
MKVRLLTSRVTETHVWRRGDEINVDADEARRLIESGAAEPVAVKKRDRAEQRG